MRSTRRTIPALLWIIVTVGAAAAADSSPPGKGPYLGQRPPGLKAEVFAPGLVSGDAFEHSRLEIAKDGSALYWIVQPARRKQQIWATRRAASGEWSQPAPLPIANGGEELVFLHSPTLSPDGRRLYFSSLEFAEGAGHGASPRATFFAVDLDAPRWNAPTPIDAWFPDPGSVWGYAFAANGELFFDSGFRLFTMKLREGRYAAPTRLGNPAIDDQEGFVPFVAPDESYLIYSSTMKGSVGGSIDLYVAFR